MLSYLSALENAIVFKGALQMSRFSLLFYFILTVVLRFYFYALVLRLGSKKISECLGRKTNNVVVEKSNRAIFDYHEFKESDPE